MERVRVGGCTGYMYSVGLCLYGVFVVGVEID